MSSAYPKLPLPIPYVPVCIPPPVQFEDQPVLEEAGNGKAEVGNGPTLQSQETFKSPVNMRKNSLKDRIMICITVILLNSIFRRFITVLNSIWAVIATLGIVCSLSLNFVCKPAIARCLRTNSNSRSVKSGGKSARSARCSSPSVTARTTSWRRIEFPRCSLHDHFLSLSGLAAHGLGG